MEIISLADIENIFLKNSNINELINEIKFDNYIDKEELITFLIEKYSESIEKEKNIFYSELLLKLLPANLTVKNRDKLFYTCTKFLQNFDVSLANQAQKISTNINPNKARKTEEEKTDELEVRNEIKFIKEYKHFQECLDNYEDKESCFRNMPVLIERASFYMLNLYKEELLEFLLNETEYQMFYILILIQRKVNIFNDVLLFLFHKKSSLLKRLNCFEFLIKESSKIELKELKGSFKVFLEKYNRKYFNNDILEIKIKQWIVVLSDCFCVEVDELLEYFNVSKEIF